MSARILTLATRNQGKMRELAEPLAAFGFEVRIPGPEIPEVEETGSSFEENALLKARTLAEITGFPALADDSGLEVEALGAAPGVYSARYGDDLAPASPEESRDQRNIRKLLKALEHTPEPRAARFCCCMALVWPQGEQPDLVVQGFWKGRIAAAPVGSNGFGYDPVFFDPEKELTAAQMDAALKMSLSHRGKALSLLLRELEKRRSALC